MNISVEPVQVVVGVIQVDANHILISKRHDHLHQGGLWEFPGGKIQRGESPVKALVREIDEELGITVLASEPLIQIPYDYGDKHVFLDVHLVTRYQGTPVGKEGQEINIVPRDELSNFSFPAANRGILAATQLPRICMITPNCLTLPDLLAHIEKGIATGIKLIQFRAHDLPLERYRLWTKSLTEKCREHEVSLVVNTVAENFEPELADGLHLTSKRMLACQQRPISDSNWLSASVHNEQELRQATAIGVDYIFISPVKPTTSHPNATPLGWEGFRSLATQATMPAYALGGMTQNDMNDAISFGAQGICGISLFH